MIISQFIKFVIVGIINLAIDIIFYLFFTRTLLVDPVVSKLVSSTIAMMNSFVWNRHWTFRAQRVNAAPQLFRFFIAQGLGVLVVSGSFALLLKVLGWPEVVSYILSVGAGTVWNFSLNKWWAFK